MLFNLGYYILIFFICEFDYNIKKYLNLFYLQN